MNARVSTQPGARASDSTGKHYNRLPFSVSMAFRVCVFIAAALLPVVSASAAPGDLRAKTQVSASYISSSPALSSDGVLYFGSSDSYLYAYDPQGVARKVFDTGGSVDDSPAIGTDGTIHFGSFDTYVYAVRPDGSLVWKYKTGDLIRSTPAIGDDGAVYVGSYDSYLYAFNPDGSPRWKFNAGDRIGTSPAIGLDGTVYFGAQNGNVYALNPDGSQKWSFRTGGAIHWSSVALNSDGTLYVGSNDTNIYALDSGGNLRWKYKTGAAVGSSPAIGADGTVYVESCDSYLYALDPDGHLKWRFAVGNTGFGCHPVIDRAGAVYVGSTDGNMYAVNPDGTLKWSFSAGSPFWTTGATIDEGGILYCAASNGCLYALDTGTGAGIADTAWPKFHCTARNTGAAASFLISPSRLAISGVASGGTGEGVISIVNRSMSAITVDSLFTSDPAFTAGPAPLTVQPGGTGEIRVRFSPHDTGEHRATLSLVIGGRTLTMTLDGNPPAEPVPVGIRILTTDGDTGAPLPCRIFLTNSLGQSILPGHLSVSGDWMFFVSSGDIRMDVLSGTYTLSIGRGNEYVPLLDETVAIPAGSGEFVIERSLKRWVDMKSYGWYSCDSQVNNYDNRTPAQLYPYQLAEDLNILHLICLGEGKTTFNRPYFQQGPFDFSQPFYPLLIGEEWRSRTWQNHMILMGHSRLVSAWGNGFYDYGTVPYPYSYPPALDICDEVIDTGGVVFGAHPFWYEPFTGMDNVYVNRNLAFELPADVALGKMIGMQIYMYWQYDEWNRWVWYRLLNCGFRLAPFAGTDALLNKMSAARSVMDPLAGRVRSYSYVPNQTTKLDHLAWIDAAVKGASFVSSGAVMLFTVNGKIPGSEIAIDAPGGNARVTVELDARWMGGLERAYFIVNGRTVAERALSGEKATVKLDIDITGSSWIACRVAGRSFDQFEGDAHSAPVYVTINNNPIRSPEDAKYFANWIDRHIALLDSAAHFENESQKSRTFDLYRRAKDVYLRLAETEPLKADETQPAAFTLHPASPNPFNSSTILSWSLPHGALATIEVFDVLGRRVKELERRWMDPGIHRAIWNGTDETGAHAGSGVYMIRLTSGKTVLHAKALLMR